MKISVLKVVDGMAKLVEAVAQLRASQVLVGVPAEEAPRDDNEPINNAALAYIHNYGSPAANIPARPFMEPGIKAAQDQITDGLKIAARSAIEGRVQGVEAGLNRAGISASESVRHQINDGDFTPLAPSTIADRLAKGFDSEKPLIRTGAMRNSITYVVREK